jgi:hypothetical protein
MAVVKPRRRKVATGGPAFPHHPGHHPSGHGAVTLRDYFAAAAIAFPANDQFTAIENAAHLAKVCYRIADAMLAERTK